MWLITYFNRYMIVNLYSASQIREERIFLLSYWCVCVWLKNCERIVCEVVRKNLHWNTITGHNILHVKNFSLTLRISLFAKNIVTYYTCNHTLPPETMSQINSCPFDRLKAVNLTSENIPTSIVGRTLSFP